MRRNSLQTVTLLVIVSAFCVLSPGSPAIAGVDLEVYENGSGLTPTMTMPMGSLTSSMYSVGIVSEGATTPGGGILASTELDGMSLKGSGTIQVVFEDLNLTNGTGAPGLLSATISISNVSNVSSMTTDSYFTTATVNPATLTSSNLPSSTSLTDAFGPSGYSGIADYNAPAVGVTLPLGPSNTYSLIDVVTITFGTGSGTVGFNLGTQVLTPEPSTMVMVATCLPVLAGLGLCRLKKRRAQ